VEKTVSLPPVPDQYGWGHARRLRCTFLPLVFVGLSASAAFTSVQGAAATLAHPLQLGRPLLVAVGLGYGGSTVAPATPGPRSWWFSVTQFRFTGSKLFASAVLAAVLEADLNRPMSFQELQSLAEKISRFYRAHGARALVVLPAQDISAHKLIFVIIEAIPGSLPQEARLQLQAPARRLA